MNDATFHFARDFYRRYALVIKMVDGQGLHSVINLKGEEEVCAAEAGPLFHFDKTAEALLAQCDK